MYIFVSLQDRELSRFAKETIVTQVRPQNVSIKLRQGVYINSWVVGEILLSTLVFTS
jgi:hypothetical protein